MLKKPTNIHVQLVNLPSSSPIFAFGHQASGVPFCEAFCCTALRSVEPGFSSSMSSLPRTTPGDEVTELGTSNGTVGKVLVMVRPPPQVQTKINGKKTVVLIFQNPSPMEACLNRRCDASITYDHSPGDSTACFPLSLYLPVYWTSVLGHHFYLISMSLCLLPLPCPTCAQHLHLGTSCDPDPSALHRVTLQRVALDAVSVALHLRAQHRPRLGSGRTGRPFCVGSAPAASGPTGSRPPVRCWSVVFLGLCDVESDEREDEKERHRAPERSGVHLLDIASQKKVK